MFKIFIYFLLSVPTFAGADCLRFMDSGSKIVWKKMCKKIVEDKGFYEVDQIDGCLAEYKNKKGRFIIFNSNLIKKVGRVKSDSIIVSAKLGTYATKNSEEIRISKITASPELFKRYKHILTFDRETQVLDVKKFQGTFSLTQYYDFKVECL